MKYCYKCMSRIEENDKECPFCGYDVNTEIPSHHLEPGTILNKKFLVGTAIGEGGFGITYIGRDIKLDMKVAIKEYYPSGYVNRSNTISPTVNSSTSQVRRKFFEEGRERFLREARTLAMFSGSRGIVDVRDFFEENNTAYIVMEYLDGQTLKAYLKERGTLTVNQTISLLMPVMESLKKVHSQNLIHRDISPDNIMLIDGGVKLLDFGAARNVSAIANKSLSVMLKPGYAPEEQYRSKGNQGPWTDIYALCATMYKCITGITPDDSTQRVFSDELKTPSALGIKIDPTIEKVLMKGLSVLQADRYQSIEELINGLKGIETKVDDDSKTVYGGVVVDEDDKPTEYKTVPNDKDITVDTPSQKEREEKLEKKQSEQEKQEQERARQQKLYQERMKKQQFEREKRELERKEREKKEQEKQEQERARQQRLYQERMKKQQLEREKREQERARQQKLYQEREKKQQPNNNSSDSAVKPNKSNKFIIIGAVLAVLVMIVVGVSFMGSSSSTVTICGEEVAKNETILRLSEKKLTSEDKEAIVSLNKLMSLYLSDCQFDSSDNDAYSFISEMNQLLSLKLSNCNVTKEQLENINFEGLKQFDDIDLSGNKALADISCLSKIPTLKHINVDGTAVKDFSSIEKLENITSLSAQDCGIKDISSFKNKSIKELYLNNNEIASISYFENFPSLSILKIANNKIKRIGALRYNESLYDLDISGNEISDLDPLSKTPKLFYLYASDNKINTLKPLSELKRLKWVYVNRNNLTDLSGLENSLELNTIQATENNISNIDGLSNCTVLTEVNINDNNVSDISILGKSVKTLQIVHFNNNNVTDISCLAGSSKLEFLSFDHNKVSSLDGLEDSVLLKGISAEYNSIESIKALESLGDEDNIAKIKKIYLSHNKISDVSAIEHLVSHLDKGRTVIDLSSNKISHIKIYGLSESDTVALHNNPITSLSDISPDTGIKLFFSYVDNMDINAFKESFISYVAVDCPKDKQVEVTNILTDVLYSTVDEADELIARYKNSAVSGTTAPEEEKNDGGE